jgi:hypothetical protein
MVTRPLQGAGPVGQGGVNETMADLDVSGRTMMTRVDFEVQPPGCKHWRLACAGPVATLTMDVDEQGGLVPGYELKLNSYDLGVGIESHEALQRLRFEHPEVRTVVVTSGKDKIRAGPGGAGHRGSATAATITNPDDYPDSRGLVEDVVADESAQVRAPRAEAAPDND